MIDTVAELRSRLAEMRATAPTASRAGDATAPRVALVSTLGAVHEGHRDLILKARELADIVVVSVFVNPLRFRSRAEFDAYPRSLESDLEMLESLGVDIVFAPSEAELLPAAGVTTRVAAGDLGLRYEGRARPGYFDGVLTIEAVLFHLVRPDVTVYGLRDRQRVFLVQRMIDDLFFDIELVAVDTVRASNGLPVSSRMALLGERDLAAAGKVSSALEAAAANADRGVDACIAAAQSTLMGEERIHLEYLSVVDPATFLPVDEDHRGKAYALIAATVADHRFIDNAVISLG